MRRLLAGVVLTATAGPRVQRLLAKVVDHALLLMGVGAGSFPHSSGEFVLLREAERAAGSDSRPLCIFDVGANQGQFLSMALTALSGSARDYRIHAFEPGSEAYAMLAERFADHPQVVLNSCALGAAEGEATLYYDRPGSGLASLSRRNLSHLGMAFSGSERVPVETLDKYCERHAITAIDLLKLDVEGHELDVLHGASRLLQARRVRMVSFEFGGANIDSRTYLRDFWELFRAHGMHRLYRILPAGRLSPVTIYRESDELFRTTNFVAMFGQDAPR